MGSPNAKNREVLLDAAEQVMREEGYAALSARSVADKAGLKHQLVYYYFRTMDDLLLAAFRRRAEQGLERQAQALASPSPLRALWEFGNEAANSAMAMEFVAMANHRKVIRSALAEYSTRFRDVEIAAMGTLLERYDVDTEKWTPALVAVMMASLSRLLVLEEAMGVTSGHYAVFDFVEAQLRLFEAQHPGNTEGAP
jgi:AcrR family transcriptional regulator